MEHSQDGYAFDKSVNTMIQSDYSCITSLLLQSIVIAVQQVVISPFLQSADRPRRHNLRPYHQYHPLHSLHDSQ